MMVSRSRRVQVKTNLSVQYVGLHQPARSGQCFQRLFQSHRAEPVLRKRQWFICQKLRGMVIGAQAVAALFQQPGEGVANGELQVQRQIDVDDLVQRVALGFVGAGVDNWCSGSGLVPQVL